MSYNTMPLKGLKVLVTRPAELASALALLLEKLGAIVSLYPVITISDSANPEKLDNILKQLTDYDIAIFISPSSVRKTFERINCLPDNLVVAAIGSSTSHLLKTYGINVNILTDGHNSENLLEHDALQSNKIIHKKILIFRGEGGREFLAETLRQRGAQVSYAESYRRQRTPGLNSLTTQQLNNLDVLTITSNEILQNLYELTNDKKALTSKPLLVPGKRAQELAVKLGFNQVIMSSNATDNACIKALQLWRSSSQ